MIKVQDLQKSYGSLRAVQGLTFQVKQGEVFGLLGPNGAGKTTTLHMMVGLLKPDNGQVTLEGGGSPLDTAWRAKIGMAPQSIALYDELTGRENLLFFGKLQGLSGKRLKEQVARVLDFVSLIDRAGSRVKTYSGGMKRRLNLAAALVHEPAVLLLDEPTAGVDPQSRNSLFENIEALQKQDCTVVYTTHYMEEAQRLCHRVAIVDHGRIMALDTVENLILTHGGQSTLVVDSDGSEITLQTDDPLAELNRLHGEGRVDSFRVERPDLEQVFLNLTGKQLRDR